MLPIQYIWGGVITMGKYLLIVLVCGLLLTGCGSTKEVSSSNQQEELVTTIIQLFHNKQYQEVHNILTKELFPYEIYDYLEGDPSVKSELISLYLINYTKLYESKDDYIEASKYLNYLKPVEGVISSNEIKEMNIAFTPMKEKQIAKDTLEYNQNLEKSLADKKNQGVSIGMSSEDVLLSSWGKPEKINKTTTENNISEQWIYGNSKYIYFDNGVVTAIQE